MIVKYYDMNSGGTEKTDFKTIFIEANNETEAAGIFEENFDRNPSNVSCTCCGMDYSVSHYSSLEAATAVDRLCEMSEDWESFEEKPSTDKDAEHYSKFKRYMILNDFLAQSNDVKIISKN